MIQDYSLKDHFNGLTAFIAVAREGSFTRAAGYLGLSQSAVSHSVKSLEKRLGVSLLMRNTRSVSPTAAGEHLLNVVAPQLQEIDEGLSDVMEMRDAPKGTIRITASDHALRSVLSPVLKKFLPKYPDIKVEMSASNNLVDIAAERYDAGIRMGDILAQDMIAVRVGPDIRFTTVGSKHYFKGRELPQTPADLAQHNCINLRMTTHGDLWPWEFEQDGQELNVRVEGQLIYNSIYEVLDGAIAGLGLGYVPEDIARPYVQTGHLISCLQEWSPPWSGYYLYYPSRRQPSGAMSLLIDALRWKP